MIVSTFAHSDCRLKAICKLLKAYALVNFKAIFVCFSARNHTDLQLHLSDPSLAELNFFSLLCCLQLQGIDCLQKNFAVVTLLSYVTFNSLIVSINIRLHFRMHFFNFLNQLVHEDIGVISKLSRFLFKILKQLKTYLDLCLHNWNVK